VTEEKLEPAEKEDLAVAEAEEAEEAQAALVPPGAAYPLQPLQTVTGASSRNNGETAVSYEKGARGEDVAGFDRDGIHVLSGQRVWVKTFRVGIPAGEGLPAYQHEANMRQVVEDVLKGGERVAGPVSLHKVIDDHINGNVTMVYVAPIL
jgi:hypothetical protein